MCRRHGALVLAVVGLSALVALSASSPGVASEPLAGPSVDVPTVPKPPKIPGAKKVRFRLTVSGTQRAIRSDRRSMVSDSCQIDSNAETEDVWTFERKSGVLLEFLLIKKRLILNRRVGRRAGDTAFETSGTVVRTTIGTGLTFSGPPPCGGSYPLSTDTCNVILPVKRDLRLAYDSAPTPQLRLSETYDLNHKYTEETSPVKSCARTYQSIGDSVVPLGGLVPTFAYPTFAEMLTHHSPRSLLSGKKQHIHVDWQTEAPNPVAGTSDKAFAIVDMTLQRVKAKKKRKR